MRRLLTALAGGADDQPGHFLYRFPLPRTGPGATAKVFTLGSRGREVLQEECGVPVAGFFRPEKVKSLSYGHLMHQLTLTRFLVAARAWAAAHPNFRLDTARLSYELGTRPPRVTLTGKRRTDSVTVIPDAWLLFEELQEGSHRRWLPVLLEIDRGTEYQQRFKEHVRTRIELIRSGAYRDLFKTEAVTIVYVTTGEKSWYRETRLKTMCTWTREVLAEQGRSAWASIFRLASLVYEELYDTPLFETPVWYQPDQPDPIMLF